ncbi:ScbR family autoregulator-binding transcription factor [Salininema proteolyticum]|uniref:ScbR family autoregulator-binding transcription factor n=1 Tax=Salininema proteolyticum TaxID=1607685 RepID=A0ABV8TYB4_9ACTN
MNRARPKQERSRQTRKQVLDAAAKAFADTGYKSTTVARIAADADVTKGALTFHFASKGDIASAIVALFYERWPPRIPEFRSAHPRALDTVWAILRELAVEFRDQTIVRAATRLQAERDFIDVELPTPFVDWTSQLTALYTEAAEAGELRTGVVPEEIARVTVSAFYGAQEVSRTLHGRSDIVERIDELILMLRLAADPDEPA